MTRPAPHHQNVLAARGGLAALTSAYRRERGQKGDAGMVHE